MLLSLMANDSSAEAHCLWSFLHDNLSKSFVSRSSEERIAYGFRQGHEERVGLFVLVLYTICHLLFFSEGRFTLQR